MHVCGGMWKATHSRSCSLQCACFRALHRCLAPVSPTWFNPRARACSLDPSRSTSSRALNTGRVSSHRVILWTKNTHTNIYLKIVDFTSHYFIFAQDPKEKCSVSLGPDTLKYIMNCHNIYIHKLLINNITNQELKMYLKCIHFIIKVHHSNNQICWV